MSTTKVMMIVAAAAILSGCGMYGSAEKQRLARAMEQAAYRCPFCGCLPIAIRDSVPIDKVHGHGISTPIDLEYVDESRVNAYVYSLHCGQRGCRTNRYMDKRFWHLEEAVSTWNRTTDNLRKASVWK